MRVPYFDTLQNIRTFLESQTIVISHKVFPHEWCEETSLLVKYIAHLPVVQGVYLGRGEEEPHFWNYDPQRKLYIDLTQDQFGIEQKIVVQEESNYPLGIWSNRPEFSPESKKAASLLRRTYCQWHKKNTEETYRSRSAQT